MGAVRSGARGVPAAAHVVLDAGAVVHVAAEAVAHRLLGRALRDRTHARALLLHHCHVLVARRPTPALRRSRRARLALLLARLLQRACAQRRTSDSEFEQRLIVIWTLLCSPRTYLKSLCTFRAHRARV